MSSKYIFHFEFSGRIRESFLHKKGKGKRRKRPITYKQIVGKVRRIIEEDPIIKLCNHKVGKGHPRFDCHFMANDLKSAANLVLRFLNKVHRAVPETARLKTYVSPFQA
jgi:hypothetical protein